MPHLRSLCAFVRRDTHGRQPAWRGRPPRTLLVRVQLDPYTGEVLQTDGLGESKLKES